ncbi:hypothetical protein SLE2022_284040 [Rubroshorea leprosula]
MAEADTVLASITVRRSYLEKLVFPKAVMQRRHDLLPATLWGQTGKADAILKGGNREPLPVTFSLGRKRDRLVFLGSGWKKVVKKLDLKEGDKVIISLDDRASSTYSIYSRPACKVDIILSSLTLINHRWRQMKGRWIKLML